jgi:hypothetical protein
VKPEDVPSAFPYWHSHEQAGVGHSGMTIRDWFAGQALMGMCASPTMQATNEQHALVSYALADSMLAEREKAR